jgi:type IV secretory pathway TraG/TraD family ATPase VirD4
MALDEVAQIAPLPSLPAIAAEGGGQGLVTLACLQDLSQARVRWGAAAEGFFSLFSCKVIFPGTGDQRTLELSDAADTVDALGPCHSASRRRRVSQTDTCTTQRDRHPQDLTERDGWRRRSGGQL